MDVQQGQTTLSNSIHKHSQNWRKSCEPPLACRCHKWMTPYLICNRTIQFSNFWHKMLRSTTKKHQVKWYCQGRCKTLLSRIVSFQLDNLFKLDIYMTFVNNFPKQWTGTIVSLVILIGCVTFSVTVLKNTFLWLMICIACTYIVIPSNQRQNDHIL